MTRLECEHGSLARSCQTCDLQKDIIELRAQLDDAAQCIARQAQTIARLLEIEKAARSLAMCEQAWCSFKKPAKMHRLSVTSYDKEHPTQKPVKLMEWCIQHAPNPATVCDPFMGSGTTGVACVRMGLQFVGIERERKYFDIACRRIEQAYAQPRLFEDAKIGAGETAVQGDMLLPANAELRGRPLADGPA